MITVMSKIKNFFISNYNIIIKYIFVTIVIGAIMYFMPEVDNINYEYEVGKVWNYSDLEAPFDFSIRKSPIQISEERQSVIKNIRPYYKFNLETTNKSIEDFTAGIQLLNSDSVLSEVEVNRLVNSFTDILMTGIIGYDKYIAEQDSNLVISVSKGNKAQYVFAKKLYDITKAGETFREQLINYTPEIIAKLNKLANEKFVENVSLDKSKTEYEINQKLNLISDTYGLVQKGELIISEGSIIDKNTYQTIQSLQQLYKEHHELSAKSNIADYMIYWILMVCFMTFLYIYRPNIVLFNKSFFLLFSSIIIIVVCVILVQAKFPMAVYAIPICLVPIILRAFFDYRIALCGLMITVMLSAMSIPESLSYCLMNMITGIIVIACMSRLEKRSQYFLISFVVFISYSIVYMTIEVGKTGDFTTIQPNRFNYYLMNAALLLISFPIIFFIEKIFGYTTDISLIELSNTNSKLLRRLSNEAPGTFQHSIQVANMAENAANKIGANVLLARVGALYHDIGKIKAPYYFTENQTNNINPHENLLPEQSAQILISHVTDGLELATKYHLPELVKNFIRTHHGTRLTSFFYRKAVEQYGKDKLHEEDFRYKGPKPFSKETAIVMMADSIEAASKSLNNPDEQHILFLVNNIIDKQIAETQFNNADITLKEIEEIKKVFIANLKSTFHLRIKYSE